MFHGGGVRREEGEKGRNEGKYFISGPPLQPKRIDKTLGVVYSRRKRTLNAGIPAFLRAPAQGPPRRPPAPSAARPAPGPSREASERPAWRSASPRREAKRLPPRSAKPPRSFSNAEIRRQRGGARIRFARPAGRAGPVYGPFWPIPPRPARPIPRPIPPKSTDIFLKISTFNFHIFTSSSMEHSPASLRSAAPLSLRFW